MGLILVFSALPAWASIPYTSCFEASARDHRLSTNLLMAVSATESNWNANARSHANAHGMMQIQWPGTAKHLGVRRVSELYKPCTNIDLGARYLRELLDRYHGEEQRALAAYNYGPGRIGRTGELPAGAQRYVATVRRHQQRLAGRHPQAPQSPKSTAKAVVGTQLPVLSTRTRVGAGRYIRALNRRVKGAAFHYGRHEGRHTVLMAVGEQGLSAADRVVLRSIGWTQEDTP
ncbi:MAG: lytic transglycosylase domain-containing protein [Pseudomonadota bacterium]